MPRAKDSIAPRTKYSGGGTALLSQSKSLLEHLFANECQHCTLSCSQWRFEELGYLLWRNQLRIDGSFICDRMDCSTARKTQIRISSGAVVTYFFGSTRISDSNIGWPTLC